MAPQNSMVPVPDDPWYIDFSAPLPPGRAVEAEQIARALFSSKDNNPGYAELGRIRALGAPLEAFNIMKCLMFLMAEASLAVPVSFKRALQNPPKYFNPHLLAAEAEYVKALAKAGEDAEGMKKAREEYDRVCALCMDIPCDETPGAFKTPGAMLTLERLLEHLNSGASLVKGTPEFSLMEHYSREARRLTAILNSGYREPSGIQRIMAEITGKPVPSSLNIFLPFYTDFGKNITLGENVFINSGCRFQDQGGIHIGNGALIGHLVVIATINHGMAPKDRQTNYVAPVRIGDNVWIGSHATILPGVSIGENSVIAAGAVVRGDVPANTVYGGVPAKFIKNIED